MTPTTRCSMLAVAMLFASSIHVAGADTAQADCQVRKEGEKKAGKSGACTFSQRQGHVNIDLRNGDSYSLVPTDQAHEFRDQDGKKVVRTMDGGNHVYKWPNKKIIVSFDHPAKK